ETSARVGYATWAQRYDEPGNPLIAMEQPVVWSLLDSAPAGDALDAACGTGRHARRLVDLGHKVVGVDLTEPMLARARQSVPEARFVQADLLDIPAGDGTFDLVVCGLALAHVEDLAAAIAELGRVLRPGGRMVVSVLHPFQAHLGWHAPFKDGAGHRGFVREYAHSHADYIGAFSTASLRVRGCVEPRMGMAEVRAKERAFRHLPEATTAAYLGLPAVLIWDVVRPESP
ncbi:MAG: class I SAM-dependent methyltransferase, partial [Kutzneria sp.]|nr:class I SAM-dependent methyltransferase [Kutzneria sp.]